MNWHEYINVVVTELEFVKEDKKLEFIQLKIRNVPDERYRSTIEAALLLYIETGSFGTPKRPKIICLTLHGIRTHGEWQYSLTGLLEDNGIESKSLSYGYKDVVTFIFPFFFKSKAIHYIKQQMDDILPSNRNAVFVLVAHSFGTYIASKLIKENPTFRFDRLILCGSIVPEKFPWETLVNFPNGGVINDCGTLDIWPVLAKAGGTDYGDSGVSGFTSNRVRNRFHNFNHSDFFSREFMERFWLPFIVDGEITKSSWDSERPSKKWIFSILTLVRGSLMYFCLILVCALLYFW